MPRLPSSLESALSEHLDGSLRDRVGHKPGSNGTLAHCRTDHDDATTLAHVLQRCLRRCEYAADVDVKHAIHLFQRGLHERFRNGRAGIVHKDVQPAEGRHGLFDRRCDGNGINGVRLNCDRPLASAFNCFDYSGSRLGVLRVRNGGVCSSAARRLATDAPMPREPPVMRAIIPSNFFDIVHLLELDICSSGMSQILLLAQSIPITTLDYTISQ
jgi:hypothetical protein